MYHSILIACLTEGVWLFVTQPGQRQNLFGRQRRDVRLVGGIQWLDKVIIRHHPAEDSSGMAGSVSQASVVRLVALVQEVNSLAANIQEASLVHGR